MIQRLVVQSFHWAGTESWLQHLPLPAGDFDI
jgi:hypothetical protein